MSDQIHVIASNRKARYEYNIEDTLEAGVVLTGTEIKAVRAGRVSLQEAFVADLGGEWWVQNMHIGAYDFGHQDNHEPIRPRKLLLHANEIMRWSEKVRQRGYTIVPLRLYIKRGRAKIEIALARGKKQRDKREVIAKRDALRNVDRALSDHKKGHR